MSTKLLVALCAAAALLTACGRHDSNGDKADTTTTPATPAETPPPPATPGPGETPPAGETPPPDETQPPPPPSGG
jgi:hypothetical protein